MGGLQRTLLAALGYPAAQEFDLDNLHSVRSLVVWLENMKIRHYAPDDRKALADVRGAEWEAAFVKYLGDLECPVPYAGPGAAAMAPVVRWLLSHAVALEYGDSAEALNKEAAERAAAEQAASASAAEADANAPPFPDLDAPEVQQQIAALLQRLGVDASSSSGGLAAQLSAAREMLADAVLPMLAARGADAGGAVGTSAAAAESGIDLAQLPLGFDTGDARLGAAATLLRLLYIRDLRRLQGQVDAAVVAVQELTANPCTDARLGKVGR